MIINTMIPAHLLKEATDYAKHLNIVVYVNYATDIDYELELHGSWVSLKEFLSYIRLNK